MKMSRVDRIQRTFQVAALFPDLDPASVTSVSLALLAPRSESPTAATVWTAYTVSSGAVTVLFVGPEADSTGGLVVPATADAWAKASGSFGEVEAVKIPDRITVAGTSSLPALPSAVVVSVNGHLGPFVTVTAADVGADATGAATAAQSAAIAAAATDATTKANAAQTAAQSYAAGAAAGMALVFGA